MPVMSFLGMGSAQSSACPRTVLLASPGCVSLASAQLEGQLWFLFLFLGFRRVGSVMKACEML